jgi:hypothetical protein
MTIDRHFLETIPASIFIAAIFYFSFRRRVQHSWRWRMVISSVLAVGIAPMVLGDISGRFIPHFYPMVLWLPGVLSDATLYSVAGIEGVFLFFILPFIVTLALVLFLWFAIIRLISRYERPAAQPD